MPQTEKQAIGTKGERLVISNVDCFRCKRKRTLKPLVTNFKCADLICDFCGYLAQVKTSERVNIEKFPNLVPGAAWEPQKERMDAGIFFPIFFVLISTMNDKRYSVWYLPTDFQNENMFKKRAPLKATARRAGWVGYNLNGKEIKEFARRIK